MTPGIHPIIVNKILSRNAPPNPLFIKTATGGSRMLSIIVPNDIILYLTVYLFFNRPPGHRL